MTLRVEDSCCQTRLMTHDGATVFDEPIRSTASELLEANNLFTAKFSEAGMSARPRRKLAIVACMDSRIDLSTMLGLQNGDAHILRNAGGVVTEDVIRSLCLSQRALGTTEIVLIHHTKCGVQGLDETDFNRQLEDETGAKPAWSFESFHDPFDDVRESIQRLRSNPFLKSTDAIAGFVYDVDTGKLVPVESAD